MKYLILGFCLFVGSVPAMTEAGANSATETSYTHIKGNREALARLDKLLAALGGRELWAEAKSLYLIQRTRSPKVGDGILSTSWRDLERPGEWGELQHAKLKVRYAWTESGGWFRRDAKYRDYIGDEVAEKAFYWHRDLYTLYHRLAKDELTYHLEALEPFGLLVRDAELKKIAELHLTRDGELFRWQPLGTKKKGSSIFGPYKSFGQARFPDWMASSDGQWGAYQIQVMPSPIPFHEQVSLGKPVREWQGGAVQRHSCERP
jgi:hypothetical protein